MADCIWHTDIHSDKIYKSNQLGVVLSSFASPNEMPQGLGSDSNDCIWNISDIDDVIYKLNQSGSIVSSFASKDLEPTGLGVDSNDCIWRAGTHDDDIVQFDQSGKPISSFASPGDNPQGIGFDSNDCIWHGDPSYFPTKILKLNQSGTIISSFAVASYASITGVGVDSNDCIWYARRDTDKIYQVNQSGSAISNFNSPSDWPTGVECAPSLAPPSPVVPANPLIGKPLISPDMVRKAKIR